MLNNPHITPMPPQSIAAIITRHDNGTYAVTLEDNGSRGSFIAANSSVAFLRVRNWFSNGIDKLEASDEN